MANEEHVKIIKKGVSVWNQWRKGNPDIQPDLREADLRSEILSGANLSNTLLKGAKLVRSSLHKANLTNANLNNAKLRWATLSGANLTEAKLSFADLREAIFNSAKLDKADLREANLSQATLQSASLNEANLSEANFSHADLRGSKLNSANLTGAHLANTNLTNAKLTHANLNKAELSKAQLKGADLSYADLDGTNLSRASLYEADLRNATFTGANLAGADFTRAIADEDQFAPNQLSNKQREQLQFSIEITVKEPASEQTDEKQAKYGEGKYGEGVYGGKNDVQVIIEEALEMFKNNKHSEAIELCDKALSINPNHIKAMNIRGTIYSRSGKYDEAITQFDVILQKEPSNVIALEGKGLALLNKNDYVATYDTFQLLAKLDPGNIAAWHSMGEALFNRESFDEAIVCLDKAIKINPHSDRSWVFKAKALLKKGKHEDAINCFDEALKNAADKSYVLVEKGIAYRELGKKSEEFNCYNLSIENNPKYIQAYKQKAHSLLQGEDYDGAIECLKKGIDNDLEPQQESILWHNLAVTYQRMKNYEEAYRSINRSLELYENEHTRMVRDAIEGDMSSKGAGSDDKNLADFKSELTDIGKELLDRLIELIRSDPAFVIKPATSNYINIRIKKPRRTALQIHRVADDPSQLGLAIAGWDADDPEIRNKYAIVRRDIKRLSGLHDTTQENFWLRGKIQSQAKRNFPPYEAKVYIIDPGILEDEDVWEELKELLQYAKEITGRGKIKEFVSKILKVFGRIATLRSDEVSDVDDLGRETLIDAFADTIIHTDFKNGFTLALMGNWGEGKSSVMEILKRKLKERQKGRFDFALFNAWEYEHTDNIAAGLSQEVVKGLQYKWNILKKVVLLLCFIFIEHWKGLLVKILYLMIPGAVVLSMYYLKVLPDKYTQYFNYGLWGVLLLGSLYVFKNAKFIFEHPLLTSMETYLRLPDYGKHLGLIPVLKRHITTLCKLKLKRSIRIPFTDRIIGRDRKLLVFVDDLDRCKSGYIAETLDAIRLVMTIPNVIVMICIDHRIAFKAIETHYRALAEKEDGNRRSSAEVARDYLGKIIQLPVRLEPVKHGKLKKYVYEKLFLFEEEKWKQFKETSEATKVTLPKDTSSLNIDKGPEPGMPEEGKGKIISAGGGGQRFDANALKPRQEKRKQDRKQEVKKSDDIEIKDRPEEGKEFYRLAGLFEFSNPRQLLRLHNSFRFLKALGRGGENDTLDMLRMLFWQEFLHNWPMKVRGRCMATLIDEVHAEKVKPIARRVLNKVREDIIKLFNEPENYAELAEFVRIVVLPHNEEGIIDTKEEINEWLKKQAEGRSAKGRRTAPVR